MGTIKDRNIKDLIEAEEIKKMCKLPDGRHRLLGNWVLLRWAEPCSVNL